MEPDASFEPFQCQSHQRPPTWEVEGGPRVRSSVVVECGYEEHMAYLRERARLWVRISEGGVRAVVLIFLGKDRKKIVFEKWVPDWCRCFEGGAVCGASVEITRDEDGDGQVVVAGAPLMVRFREMFRRDPTEDGERDYVFAEDELGDMAEVVWMRMEDFAEGG
ncbi:hypothetical protein BJY04DRAFT_223331 [Aspergillus karnatakaensis]|uniref:uncharacterized protein n=1 Tax=Aspergillus karnatakaensis TaxID=1810916 RepID=UPI003CCD6099